MNSHEHDSTVIPSLYIQNKGEKSVKIALRLTSAPSRVVMRITGGCANMSSSDATGMYNLFTKATKGFDGGILIGGTRMISKENDAILDSVTEIPTRMRAHCPNAVVLGVIPRTADLRLVPGLGLVVSEDPSGLFATIVHPDQNACLLVQQSVDTGVEWEAEYRACIEITESLREFANWQSVLLSYNGGSVTKKEIFETAGRGWPVVLIKGSGRVTDELAGDDDFLKEHKNVVVADKTPESLRDVLVGLGALHVST